jgi:hypothetical protein
MGAGMSRSALVEERKHFLARSLGVFIALLGLSMLGVLVANVLGNGTAGVQNVSWAQILQGCLGALFLALVIRGYVARAVLALANDSAKRLDIFLIPLMIWPFFLLYRVQISDLKSYLRRISEGSLVEWLGFLLLLAAACLLWKSAVQASSNGLKLLIRSGSVGLFVLSMEEMSWGQMIFNWGTPATFNEHNVQHETNIHNLSFWHSHTWTVAACVFTLLFLLSVCGFLVRCSGSIRLGSWIDVILPLGCTASYFGVAALMYWGVVAEKNGIDLIYLHTREQEIAEFLFAVGVFIHVVYLYLSQPDMSSVDSVSSGN